jgi:hypothetical protein
VDQLTLDVPTATLTHFVVATTLNISDPIHLVAGQLDRHRCEGHPLAAEALTLLQSPSVQIEQLKAPESGWGETLQGVAGEVDQLREVAAARYHQLVSVSTPTRAQPRPAQLSRLIARILTRSTKGVLVDPVANIVLADSGNLDRETAHFDLSNEWLTIFLTQDDETGAAVKAETWGLTRFGVPELRTGGFSPDVSMIAANLLRGLAIQLLREHWKYLASPAATSRLIDTDRYLDVADVYRYYGRPPHRHGRLAVRLRHLPRSPTADLEVLPPTFMQGSTGRWWRNYAALTIPGLTH